MNTEPNEEVQPTEKRQWIEPEFKDLELNSGTILADSENFPYYS